MSPFFNVTQMLEHLGFPNITQRDKFSFHYYTVGLLSVDVRYHNGEHRNSTFKVLDSDAQIWQAERFNPALVSSDERMTYITTMADSGVAYGTIARIFDTTTTRIRALIEADDKE